MGILDYIRGKLKETEEKLDEEDEDMEPFEKLVHRKSFPVLAAAVGFTVVASPFLYLASVISDCSTRHEYAMLANQKAQAVIKQYQEETNLRGYCIIDSSSSMGYSSGTVTKLEYASYLAAAIIYLMIKQRDSSGLITYSEKLDEYVPPRNFKAHMHYVFSKMESLKASGRTDFNTSFTEIGKRIKKRSLLILFSDLLEDEEGMSEEYTQDVLSESRDVPQVIAGRLEEIDDNWLVIKQIRIEYHDDKEGQIVSVDDVPESSRINRRETERRRFIAVSEIASIALAKVKKEEITTESRIMEQVKKDLDLKTNNEHVEFHWYENT